MDMTDISLSNLADTQLLGQCAAALPGWVWALTAPFVAGVLAHVDPFLKQPGPGSLWLLIRKPISLLAGNYGWARNADQETLAEWWDSNRQRFAAWLVRYLGDALKTEVLKAIEPKAPEADTAAPAAQPQV